MTEMWQCSCAQVILWQVDTLPAVDVGCEVGLPAHKLLVDATNVAVVSVRLTAA
jgi:hypothetical protein